MKVVALEEHFSTALDRGLIAPPEGFRIQNLKDNNERAGHDLTQALLDLGHSRLAAMDAHGISFQVLSLTQPGVQAYEGETALRLAREVNERALEAVRAHPDRFAAFAALPSFDPAASVKELERCVALGFKGTMLNGHQRGEFLDDRKYWPIFECAQALGVPVYLHPTVPHPLASRAYFEGHEAISRAAWGFMVDTGTHFLRLVMAGLFDRFPALTMILGHLGEGIPFCLDRMESHTYLSCRQLGLKKTVKQYIMDHLVVTTSGNFSIPSVMCTIQTLGVERVLFSVDWPYERNEWGMTCLKALPVSEAERELIAHGNAERVLKL